MTPLKQLHRVRDLSTGLDWILMCPDLAARESLLELVTEEIGATVDGVVYWLESAGGAAVEAGIEPGSVEGAG